MTADFEEPDDFTRSMEVVHCAAARLPALLDEAVDGVALYARGLSGLVQDLDARRAELNRWARDLNAVVPDHIAAAVPSSDANRARLVAAARRGPAETALALGKAARLPALLALPETETETDAGLGDASRAAAALLSWQHHQLDDVDPRQLIGDADPYQVASLLAAMAIKLAAEAVPDVGAWVADVGATYALDGE